MSSTKKTSGHTTEYKIPKCRNLEATLKSCPTSILSLKLEDNATCTSIK